METGEKEGVFKVQREREKDRLFLVGKQVGKERKGTSGDVWHGQKTWGQ